MASSSTTEPWASWSRFLIVILVRPSSTVIWTGMSRIMSRSFSTPAFPRLRKRREDVGGLGARGTHAGVHRGLLGHGGRPVILTDLAVVFGDGAFGIFHFVSHSCLQAPPRLLLRRI